MLPEAVTNLLALTHATNQVTRFTGAHLLLPALTAKRFAAIGAIREDVIVQQLKECKSLADATWKPYWMSVAMNHLARLDEQLAKAGLPSFSEWLKSDTTKLPDETIKFIRAGAEVITTCSLGGYTDLEADTDSTPFVNKTNQIAADALHKGMAYLVFAAWPGGTPQRQKAYQMGNKVLAIFVEIISDAAGVRCVQYSVTTSNEVVQLYGLYPAGKDSEHVSHRLPAVLVTNGLKGTNAETLATLIRARPSHDMVRFCMEMPGTYAYISPMQRQKTETIYKYVISFISALDNVDASRIGMLGISFGATWAVYMAYSDPRIKAVVANGAALGRSLVPASAFGTPEAIIQTLQRVSGARFLASLGIALGKLAPTKSQIASIQCPLLAVNGENDTLVSVDDTRDLAAWAPNAELKLYEDDDHCAMKHLQDWNDYCIQWFEKKL